MFKVNNNIPTDFKQVNVCWEAWCFRLGEVIEKFDK